MRQVLKDAQGRIIWTNDPPARADKPSGTGAGRSPWRTRPQAPNAPEQPEEDFSAADKAQHLKTFRGFNSGRPKGR